MKISWNVEEEKAVIRNIAEMLSDRGESFLSDEGTDWHVCVEVAEEIVNWLRGHSDE